MSGYTNNKVPTRKTFPSKNSAYASDQSSAILSVCLSMPRLPNHNLHITTMSSRLFRLVQLRVSTILQVLLHDYQRLNSGNPLLACLSLLYIVRHLQLIDKIIQEENTSQKHHHHILISPSITHLGIFLLFECQLSHLITNISFNSLMAINQTLCQEVIPNVGTI